MLVRPPYFWRGYEEGRRSSSTRCSIERVHMHCRYVQQSPSPRSRPPLPPSSEPGSCRVTGDGREVFHEILSCHLHISAGPYKSLVRTLLVSQSVGALGALTSRRFVSAEERSRIIPPSDITRAACTHLLLCVRRSATAHSSGSLAQRLPCSHPPTSPRQRLLSAVAVLQRGQNTKLDVTWLIFRTPKPVIHNRNQLG